ncbi:type II toxin-antitoxin system HipA family toxin [Thorsellia anophelis]|uniref:Serine/threonine-protein kinase HipA n=1 Tax=Thorsellia anophelis DSM 18579 TaxID=1123402 RepID=A0A1I0CLU5_9GAMM|nr:HipA domain-containing protein [Thorsellia anophelis]SET20178.1 serine/threonine-protein kinase HipA [Thorsellia anophelis DSM 18579]
MSSQIIEVYADWIVNSPPILIGELKYSHSNRGGIFSFRYDSEFLKSPHCLQIDPMLDLYAGDLYNDSTDRNFRVFLDSCPDRWGRILMQRRAAIEYKSGRRQTSILTELDYLLGVHDSYRMGGIRFKLKQGDSFLDNSTDFSAPPIASLRELEYAALQLEADSNIDRPEYYQWLSMLISPGSSLGGARPKACVRDTDNHLWIAKFPNLNDTVDMGAWEMLAYQLAIMAKIEMYPSRLQKLSSIHHTFLTKRFDRIGSNRIHFSSAMTQLKYYDGNHSHKASYLEIAEFLTRYGTRTSEDLSQLWRRVVFNIAISNTDDHLRNHGFLLNNKGWKLSPAFDLNPSIEKQGLHLNVTDNDNSLDYDLAFDTIDFYHLSLAEANKIYDEVLESVKNWQKIANQIGISRAEQLIKQEAFRI